VFSVLVTVVGPGVNERSARRAEDTQLSTGEPAGPFIDAGQYQVAEVYGPQAVVDFLESDLVIIEGVAQKEQLVLETKRPALVIRFTTKWPG
jgi:hypothetical protein